MQAGTENQLSSYFSTLAQVTATLLALLAAGASAYAVFLHERRSQFDEAIEKEKLEIRDLVIALRHAFPSGLDAFLPLDFSAEYRSQYPNLTSTELTAQVAQQLLIEPGKIGAVYAKFEQSDYFKGKHIGRAYLWVLSRTVAGLTRRSPIFLLESPEVYPDAANAAGFESWREQFKKLQETLALLQMLQPSAVGDLQEWEAQLPPDKNRHILPLVQRAIADVTAKNGEIRQKLTELDKQQLLGSRYDIDKRLHFRSLLVLGTTSALLGIVVPMFALATAMRLNGWAAATILIASVILTTGSFVQFVTDIAAPSSINRKQYLVQRWFHPMQGIIEYNLSQAANGADADAEFFTDAIGSADYKFFPADIQDLLAQANDSAREYNQACTKLNDTVKKLLRDHLGHTAELKPGMQEISINFAGILSDEKFAAFVKNVRSANPTIVSYEELHSGWMRYALRFPVSRFNADPDYLVRVFDPIRAAVKGSPAAREYELNLQSLKTTQSRLKERLGR